MSDSHYLVDRTRREVHLLGHNSIWLTMSGESWATEESLFRALFRDPRSQGRTVTRHQFYWATYVSAHVWSVTRGFGPFCNRYCLDHLVILSGDFVPSWPAEWPTVWTAYVPVDDTVAWTDEHRGPGLFEIFEVMDS